MRLKSLLQKLPLFSDKGDSAERTIKEKQRARRKKEKIVIPNLRLSVGGDYEFMGDALRVRLERFGLKEGDYLIDVGCGSGVSLTRSRFPNIATRFVTSESILFPRCLSLRLKNVSARPGVSSWLPT